VSIKCRSNLETTETKIPGKVKFSIVLQGDPGDTRGTLRIDIDDEKNCVYFGNGEKFIVTEAFSVSAGSTRIDHNEMLVGLDGTPTEVCKISGTVFEGDIRQCSAAGVVNLAGCNCAADLSKTTSAHLTSKKAAALGLTVDVSHSTFAADFARALGMPKSAEKPKSHKRKKGKP
jgi:hypothetical protein